jgi:hypothetical protein
MDYNTGEAKCFIESELRLLSYLISFGFVRPDCFDLDQSRLQTFGGSNLADPVIAALPRAIDCRQVSPRIHTCRLEQSEEDHDHRFYRSPSKGKPRRKPHY